MKCRRCLAAVAISLVISLVFTGCWDSTELTEIIPVIGVGIDDTSKGKDSMKLTLQVGKAAESSTKKDPAGGQSQFLIYEKEGKNVFKMLRDVTHESSQKLFFGHNQCIIFGKKDAEQGVKTQLDLFMRDHEPRMDVWILVADNTANEILKTKSDISSMPAMDITNLIKKQAVNSESVHVNLLDFASKIASDTTCPVASIISLDKKGEHPRFLISGMAAFKRDKMVAEFDGQETRGYLWAINKIESGTVNVQTKKGRACLEIRSSGGKLNPKLEPDGSVSLTITVKAGLSIQEMAGFEDETLTTSAQEIQKSAEEKIRSCVLSCFQKSQRYKADIYGIGKLLSEKESQKWPDLKKDWDGLYSQIKPRIEVQVDVKSAGEIIQLKG